MSAHHTLRHVLSHAGVRHIFDESDAPITVVAFAKVRSDLLAIGNADGQLWFIELSTGVSPTVRMVSHV